MSRIIKKMYRRVIPFSVLSILVGNLNVLVDGYVTGNLIGAEDLGVLGLAGPLFIFLGLYYVPLSGANVLCGNYIGKGDKQKTTSIFTQCVMLTLLWSAFWMIIIFTFSGDLANCLSNGNAVSERLQAYLTGYAIGIIPMSLYSVMSSFLIINGNGLLLNISIGVMVATNLFLDILFAGKGMGMFGMGLATSISYLVVALLCLPCFLPSKQKEKIIHFSKSDFVPEDIREMLHLGIGSLVFTLAGMLSSFILNRLIINTGGEIAMSAYTVKENLVAITNAIGLGMGSATATMTSILYGEANRKNLRDGVVFPQIITISLSVVLMLFLILLREPITSIYVSKESEVFPIAEELVFWLGCSLPPAGFYVFVNIYQSQKKITMSIVASLLYSVVYVVLSLILCPSAGIRGIGYSMVLTPIASTLIVWIITCFINRRISFKFENLYLFDDDYGLNEENRFFRTISTIEDVVKVSDDSIKYFRHIGLNTGLCYKLGLCVEEMCANTLIKGNAEGKKDCIEITTDANDNTLTLIIKDDCKMFDPLKYLENFDTDTSGKNIGILMVSKLADTMEYQRLLEMNIVRIVFTLEQCEP